MEVEVEVELCFFVGANEVVCVCDFVVAIDRGVDFPGKSLVVSVFTTRGGHIFNLGFMPPHLL